MSRNTAVRNSCPSSALLMLSDKRWHYWIVEWALLNPNWCSGTQSCKCVYSVSLLSRRVSRIFEITGRRLIGLYETTSVGGLAGFNTIIIFASLKVVDQYSRRIIEFRIYSGILNPGVGSSRIIWAVMFSGPGALCGWGCLITQFISMMVNADSFSWRLVRFVNLFSMSGSNVLSCGVNTSDKCLANNSAFSSSLLAHGPGGVEFLRIGGFGIVGFFRDLSGFQIEWSEHFTVETYSVKLSLRILWSAVFSLLLAFLKSLRSSGACVFCHIALAFLLSATRSLIVEGILFTGTKVLRSGVASTAASWSMWVKLVEAISRSSQFTRLHISVLWVCQLVYALWSLGLDFFLWLLY